MADEEGMARPERFELPTTWFEVARREGVTEKDCAKIASAFAYPGIRLETSG